MKSALVATPPTAAFGLVVEGSGPQERRVKLTAAPGETVAVTLPEQPPDRRFQYALETKTPGQEYEVVIRLVPPYAMGGINESVVLLVDHPKQKSFEVRASGTVAPRLGIDPPALQVQETPAGQPYRGTVTLSNRGDSALKVLKASCDAPEVLVSLIETMPGKSFAVQVEVPQSYTPPPGGVRVRLTTDDAQVPELAFPILPKPQPRPSPIALLSKPAPPFSLTTLAGKPVSNATAAKAVTLLNFFAVDCPHCKRQIPRLTAVLKEYAGKPVRLVMVAQKMRGDFTADQVREVLRASGVDPDSLEIVVEMSNVTGAKFQASSYPALVLVGRDGIVSGAVLGNAQDLEAQVKGHLGRLLGESPAAAAPAAR